MSAGEVVEEHFMEGRQEELEMKWSEETSNKKG